MTPEVRRGVRLGLASASVLVAFIAGAFVVDWHDQRRRRGLEPLTGLEIEAARGSRLGWVWIGPVRWWASWGRSDGEYRRAIGGMAGPISWRIGEREDDE